MDKIQEPEKEQKQDHPLTDTTSPPSGLGVYDRPNRPRLTLPIMLALLILALIVAILIWQLWL